MPARDRKATRGARSSALALLSLLPLAACGTSTTEIHGAQLQAFLAQVSVADVPGELLPGSPPMSGSGPTASAPADREVITGGSAQMELAGSAAYRSVAVFMDGVDGYYLVELPEAVSSALMVTTMGNRLPTLEFSYAYAIAGPDGVFGPVSVINVNALEVIGGDIQVSVTWNTLADVDLHVIDPRGEEIFYGNRSSTSGGQLDLDANAACSTSNIFQENIGWNRDTAPSGQYIVRVDYWDACGALETDFVVTVNVRPGVPATPITPGALLRTYTGTFTGPGTQGGAGDGRTIATFTF